MAQFNSRLQILGLCLGLSMFYPNTHSVYAQQQQSASGTGQVLMSGSQSQTGSPATAYSVHIPAHHSAAIADLVHSRNLQQQQTSASTGSSGTVVVGQQSGSGQPSTASVVYVGSGQPPTVSPQPQNGTTYQVLPGGGYVVVSSTPGGGQQSVSTGTSGGLSQSLGGMTQVLGPLGGMTQVLGPGKMVQVIGDSTQPTTGSLSISLCLVA